MPLSTRQQKLDKLCRGHKILRPRLTKYWRRRVPGGVDAYDHTYDLRSCRHSLSLTAKTDCNNFLNRLLVKDIY